MSVSGRVVNPFRDEAAARRYATGRLDVHADFVERIVGGLGGGTFRRVLDVGCGTGLSTRPLSDIASSVIGCDLARPMLLEAARGVPSALVQARAEALPFPRESFDLVTLGCVFHWCDPATLLTELHRVLARHGHLAVYDHYFAGSIEGEPRFADWHEAYRARFAAPPRHPNFEPAVALGFEPVARERFEQVVPLAQEDLLLYVMSQSNVLWAMEQGPATEEEIERDLAESLAPIFGGRQSAHFVYVGELDLLRKSQAT